MTLETLLARTFASFCLGRKPKARVATIYVAHEYVKLEVEPDPTLRFIT